MRLRNHIFGIITAAFCLSACEPADPELKHETMPCKPYSLTRAQSEMVDGGNSFAFNLLEAVSNDENFTGKDFMVSPLSVSLLLGGFFANSVQPPAEHVTFHADRPFIYLIQEQSSNAIFFIGTKVRS